MTKTEKAFVTLRSAIEDGTYRPGEHLRLARLVTDLDMSPTPIREALRLLQAEGLVEHHPHRGMLVAQYSPESAAEVYRLRVLLEPLAARLAVDRATPEEVAEVRRRHDELVAAVEDGSRTDAAERNADWHRAIYAASRSRFLEEFIARLWQALPVRAMWLSRRAERSLAQHRRIMEAIEAGDGAGAEEAMRRHIELGGAHTVEHLRTLGDGSA
jgi:DNA-binding GntR family transcriptional regulator